MRDMPRCCYVYVLRSIADHQFYVGLTRDLTHDLVERIQTTTKLDPIPHLTCVCHQEDEIESILIRYAKTCIGNILALAGDPPRGCSYDKSGDALQHAIDLVKFIRRFN